MERERVAPLSGFIVIEIVQSVKEEGRKEGRKGLAQFPAAWRKRGGVGERERERDAHGDGCTPRNPATESLV